jgi:hypothetical protein
MIDAHDGASLVLRDPDSPSLTSTAFANRASRFVQKFVFGERRRAAKAVSTKIYLLPKFATQSPRTWLFGGNTESQMYRPRIDRRFGKSSKCLLR